MASEIRFSKPPKDIADAVASDAKRVEDFIKNRKLRLSEDQVKDFEAYLDKVVSAWKKQTSSLRKKLVELNELLEGVVEETSFPFVGASKITTHYAAGMERTFSSTFNRTVFNDPNIFIIRKNPGSQDADIEKLENSLNYVFGTATNGLDCLKTGSRPVFRDGTLIISGTWERRVEMCYDYREYSSFQEFQKDYPSAADAGISQEEYDEALDHFVVETMPLRVEFDYDFVEQDGPEFSITPLARFLFHPISSTSVSRMSAYGRQYFLTPDELKLRAKRKYFYQSAVDRFLTDKNAGGKIDAWQASANRVEGLLDLRDNNSPKEIFDLVVKRDVDGDGIPEKYYVSFSAEGKILLSAERYRMRRNTDIACDFRLKEREDRFLGESILESVQDLLELLDDIHKHRNNVRMLVASPVLLAKDKYKDEIDLGRAENVMRPGLTFWVDDPATAVKQLNLQNLDQPGNSADEENLVVRYMEIVSGVTQGQSGKETNRDPRAPAAKTIALMNQANQRTDDYIQTFSKGFPSLAELFVALLTQYSPVDENGMMYVIRDGRRINTGLMKGQLIGLNRAWDFPRRSVNFTPEYTMRRISALAQFFGQLLPLLVQGVPQAVEYYNRMVIASGEPDADKLLFTAPPQQQQIQQQGGQPQGGQPQGGQQQLPTGRPPQPKAVLNPSETKGVVQNG